MNKAVTVATMRESDAWTIANKVPSKELMRRAGEGIFRAGSWNEPIAIVCGSGNNAGDGFVVADLLHKENKDVTIVLLSNKFSEDGKYYYDICVKEQIPIVFFSTDSMKNKAEDAFVSDSAEQVSEAADPLAFTKKTVHDFCSFATILDCILGTGFEGEPRDPAKAAIDAINNSGAYVISADINSGLNGDTGLGSTYVQSDLTVSIGDYKLGHFKGLADSAMKSKVNVDIGIEIQGDYVWI